MDELRERRRVEREKRKGVGFWGTVLGVEARRKGRGEVEKDQIDENEDEEDRAEDDGSGNEEKKGGGDR